ncbi:large ribosomal RNA subunit accumulation protein YCED homolog 1, chloroplastic [Nymphaea colorata]|nr:large ribosomal RNA subunit accumulation protein YCED homolog 1, chloroplastic [Nymphaea colorata]
MALFSPSILPLFFLNSDCTHSLLKSTKAHLHGTSIICRGSLPPCSRPQPSLVMPLVAPSRNPFCSSHSSSSCSSSSSTSSSFLVEEFDFDSETEAELPDSGIDVEGSLWEGAVVYRRDPSVTHLEYCTTLERLGLGRYSSDASRSKASSMGIRVTRAVKEFTDGTAVQVSVDVSRSEKKKGKLRLDGIVRTVIALPCNRCAEPAAECIFSNFSLSLTEEPIQEHEPNNWLIIGQGNSKTFDGNGEDDEEDAFDLDDVLHFPVEDSEIDISKQIRDTIHVEIKITALCDPSCKGLCLKCGTNLNRSTCSCGAQGGQESGPLRDLRSRVENQQG